KIVRASAIAHNVNNFHQAWRCQRARSALMYAWSYISPFGPSMRTASSCAGSKNAAAKAWSNESCELKESVGGETFELLMRSFQSPAGDMVFCCYPLRYPRLIPVLPLWN